MKNKKKKFSHNINDPYGKRKVTYYLHNWVIHELRKIPKGTHGRFVERAVIQKGGFKKPK